MLSSQKLMSHSHMVRPHSSSTAHGPGLSTLCRAADHPGEHDKTKGVSNTNDSINEKQQAQVPPTASAAAPAGNCSDACETVGSTHGDSQPVTSTSGHGDDDTDDKVSTQAVMMLRESYCNCESPACAYDVPLGSAALQNLALLCVSMYCSAHEGFS